MTQTHYRVYWDGFGLSGYSGVATYGRCLRQELAKLGVEPTVVGSPHSRGRVRSKLLNSKVGWCISQKQRFDQLVDASKPAVIHGLSNFNLPFLAKPASLVLTIHDVIPLLAKTQVSWASWLQLSYCLKRLLPVTSAVICGSQWTKETLLDWYGGDLEEKINVISYGYPPFQGRKRPRSKQSKLLFVSRYEGYKNFSLLIKILSALPQEFLSDIVTDAKGAQVLSAHSGARVRVHQGISEEKLQELYEGAQLLLQTSHYEGFGLPLARALSYGVPVVFQAGSGSDEVCPPSCSLAMSRAASVSEWVEAIREVAQWQAEEGFWQRCEAGMLEKPSWAQCARLVLGVYDKVIGGMSP